MTRPLQAKLLILAVFALGAVSGAVIKDVYDTRSRSAFPGQAERGGRGVGPESFQRFEEFLELDADQRARLDAILEASGESYRALRAETRPMYQDIREQSMAEIRAILTDEQAARYDEWIRRIEEFRGRGGRGADE